MVYSPFLQQMAVQYRVTLDNQHQENKLLVCRYVLRGWDGTLTKMNHPKIFSAMRRLEGELFKLRAEFEIMNDQQELRTFYRMHYLKSPSGVYQRCREAYNHASGASQAYDDEHHTLASSEIDRCHDQIKKALSEFTNLH